MNDSRSELDDALSTEEEAQRRVALCLEKGRDHLNLVGLGLGRLPQDFAKLTGLRYLDLTDNALRELPEAICDFADLRWLGLNGNRLEQLPEGIGQLQSLERLYLRNNRLQHLPEQIGALSRLVELDLYGNHITNLPLSFLDLLERGETEAVLHFDLEGNPGQVAAVASQGAAPLVAYLRKIRHDSVVVRQGKLLFVGEGRVGKSTLLHALQGGSFLADRSPTHGLKLGALSLRLDDGDVQLNSWDFSGQKEQRETHQIFFTAPAIYLIVWRAGLGEHMARLGEWLWLVKHRTEGRARVVIVATEAGEFAAQLDATEALQKEFGGEEGILLEPGFLEVECDERSPEGQFGIEALKALLAQVVAEDEGFRQEVPRSWQRVQADMEKLRDERPFLKWDEFEDFCNERNLDDARSFARAQHRMGRLVWIEQGALAHTVILNADWLSRAIGLVFHHRDRKNQSATGSSAGPGPTAAIMSEAHIHELWRNPPARDEEGERLHGYPEEVFGTFVRLMEAFDLSHPIRISGHEPRHLIPNRLPARRPATWSTEWSGEQVGLRRRVDLLGFDDKPLNEWMASAFLYRLMVRLHPDAVGREDPARLAHWRHGLRLERYYCSARLYRAGHRLYFEVVGEQPFAMWERVGLVLETLARDLHHEFGYEIRRRILVPCGPDCTRDTSERYYIEEEEIRRWAASPYEDERLEEVPCHARGCTRILTVHRLWAGERQQESVRIDGHEVIRRLYEIKEGVDRGLAQQTQILEALQATADRMAPEFRGLMARFDELESNITTELREGFEGFVTTIQQSIDHALRRLDHAARLGPLVIGM